MRAWRDVGKGEGTILVGGRLDRQIHDPDLHPARGNLAQAVQDHALKVDLWAHRHQNFFDDEFVCVLDLHWHWRSIQRRGLELELPGCGHRRRVEVWPRRHHHLHVAHPSCVFHFDGKHHLGAHASGTLVFRIDRLDELSQLRRPQALAGFPFLARRRLRLPLRCQGRQRRLRRDACLRNLRVVELEGGQARGRVRSLPGGGIGEHARGLA